MAAKVKSWKAFHIRQRKLHKPQETPKYKKHSAENRVLTKLNVRAGFLGAWAGVRPPAGPSPTKGVATQLRKSGSIDEKTWKPYCWMSVVTRNRILDSFPFFFTQNEYEEKGRIFSFVQAESKVRAGNSHGSWRVCGHRRITTWGAPGWYWAQEEAQGKYLQGVTCSTGWCRYWSHYLTSHVFVFLIQQMLLMRLSILYRAGCMGMVTGKQGSFWDGESAESTIKYETRRPAGVSSRSNKVCA